MVCPVTSHIVTLPRFGKISVSIVQTLLCLRPNRPTVDTGILGLLQYRPLAPCSDEILNKMINHSRSSSPLQVLQSFTLLVRTIANKTFIVYLSRLRSVRDVSRTKRHFQQTMRAVIALTRVPGIVIILSYLRDFCSLLGRRLPGSRLSHLRLSPAPVDLDTQHSRSRIERVLSQQLRGLCRLTRVSIGDSRTLCPFPSSVTRALTNRAAHSILR